MANIVKGKIGNALESVAPDGIVATADAIYDETKGKSQEQINEDTKQLLAEQANNIGYYECDTAAATAAKEITGGSYKLPDAAPYGGSIKVKFKYKNSAVNPTLSIDGSPAKPLYYNGSIASSTNTWEDGDVLDLYYDGTNFNARSVVEKFATGEKVKNVGIDSEPTADSNNLVKSGGVFEQQEKDFFNTDGIRYTIQKSAGSGQDFNITLEEGVKVKLSLGNVSSQDVVAVFGYINATQTLLFQANKVDKDFEYTVPANFTGFRITDNTHSDVTLTVGKVISENELKESVDKLTEDVNEVYNGVYAEINFDGTIPGGVYANYALSSNLKNKIEYLLSISGTGSRGNWGIKPLYDNNADHGIPFTLDGVTKDGYARNLSNGDHLLTFDNTAPYNVASHIRVVDLEANVTIKITSPISKDIITTIDKNVGKAIEEYDTEITNPNTDTVDTVNIPQRESSGGSDFVLTNPLNAGCSYKLIKTCSGTGYNNLVFKNAGDSVIPFYLDGKYRTGYVSFDDGEHTVVLTDVAVKVRSTDNTTTSISLVFKNNYLGLNQINYNIVDKLYPLYDKKDLYDNAVKQVENQGICIDDYINSINAYRLIASNNGVSMVDALNNNIITRLYYENTVHDSQIVVKNGVCYVVYAANTALVDNASSPTSKVILSKFNLSDVSTREDVVVAKNGEHSLTGGAGQPNIFADVTDSDKLHVVFTANINGFTIVTCDYSIASGECSNYREVVIANKAGITGNARNSDINNLFGKTFNTGNNYYSQQCNSTISYYNDYYYIGMVMADENGSMSKNLAVIFKTQDFTNWTYFADYDRFNVPSHCELAIGVDSNGMIYSASRRLPAASVSMGQYGANYGVIAKWNASSGNLIERSFYRNCGSRPSFFRNGDDLYLFSNNWYRSICDIIKIDARQLNASWLFAQFKKSAYHYVSFAIDGDKVVCSSSSDGIEISKFTWPTSMTDTQAFAKIAELLA